MMKSLIYCCFLFAAYNLYAQQDPGNSANVSQLKYVDILPPSPASASLVNFKRPETNLSTGAVHFNLPITSLVVGDFTLPIQLNYTSGGVKVDEIASRVGITWQLEAGGAITRVISGAVDENSTYNELPANLSTSSREFLTFLKQNYNNTIGGSSDTQPDIFSYNFCGISGKFFLNAQDQIVEVVQSNLKIEKDFQGTAWNFKITDTNGNKFYFGGDLKETSRHKQTCERPLSSFHPTAWFLNKIELYNGRVIILNYLYKEYEYDLGINQSHYYIHPNSSTPCGVCSTYPENTCVNIVNTKTYYLSSIICQGNIINFSYSNRSDYGDVLLTGITKSYNSTLIESYNLTYEQVYTQKGGHTYSDITGEGTKFRPFLKRIARKSGNELIELYSFEYNDPAALPVRLAYSQDHWGYYNGSENSTLVPRPSDYYQRQMFPRATANREPNAAYGEKGMLSKIIYATGGYDSITYEGNTYYKAVDIYPTARTTISSPTVQGIGFRGGTVASMGSFTLHVGQTINIEVKAYNATQSATTLGEHYTNLYLYKDGQWYKTYTADTPDRTATSPNIKTFTEELPPGNYFAEIYASGAVTKGEGSINYVAGRITQQYKNVIVGGVRVKRISSYSLDNKFLERKNYHYYSTASPSISSAQFLEQPSYIRFQSAGNSCTTSGGFEEGCSVGVLFSSSLTNLFLLGGNHIAYSHVIESSGINQENGYIEHEYNVQRNLPGSAIVGSPALNTATSNNADLSQNREIQTSYFKKNGSSFEKVKSIQYKYSFSAFSEIVGTVVNRLYEYNYESSGTPYPHEFNPYEATRYSIVSSWPHLDTVIERYFENNALRLINKTNYEYANSISKLPSKIVTERSDGSKFITVNKYPSDADLIPGLPEGQSTLLNNLISNNIVTPLVYQESFVNDLKISSYRLLFKNTWTGFTRTYPWRSITYDRRGNEGKTFELMDYDSYGNIKQKKNYDGIIHSFLWDYNASYPIAEFTGASFNQVAASSFETNGNDSQSVNGNWNVSNGTYMTGIAYTGERSFTLGTLTKSSLSIDERYILSYWYKNGSTVRISGKEDENISITKQVTLTREDGWTNITCEVTGITTLFLTGSGYIDEVKLYPVSAQVTTLTHTPSVGVSSITDTNINSHHYQYDTFNRLKTIQDSDHNVTNSYEYKYIKSN